MPKSDKDIAIEKIKNLEESQVNQVLIFIAGLGAVANINNDLKKY